MTKTFCDVCEKPAIDLHKPHLHYTLKKIPAKKYDKLLVLQSSIALVWYDQYEHDTVAGSVDLCAECWNMAIEGLKIPVEKPV